MKWKYYNITNTIFRIYWLLYMIIIALLLIGVCNEQKEIDMYKEYMVKSGIAEYRITIDNEVYFVVKEK